MAETKMDVEGRTSERQQARITNPARGSDLGSERLFDVREPMAR
jgi:hypothetical protein